MEALNGAALDNGEDDRKFREDLMNVARTTLRSKILTHDKDHLARRRRA